MSVGDAIDREVLRRTRERFEQLRIRELADLDPRLYGVDLALGPDLTVQWQPQAIQTYVETQARALELLESVVPERDRMPGSHEIRMSTTSYRYRIRRESQTQIFDRRGRHIANACLQLTVPAPGFDRMVAEYLLLRNDEALYWSTANIFLQHGGLTVAELALIALNAGLAVHVIVSLVYFLAG